MRKTVLIIAAISATAPALAQQDIHDTLAFKHYTKAFGELCYWGEESAAAEYYPSERWELTWQTEYSDTPDTATLYKFYCDAGAYNVNHIFYLETDYGGPLPIGFATPSFDVRYEKDDFEGAVLDIVVDGYSTQLQLTNSEYDPETQTITSHALWRGIGDAASTGTWRFDQGQFVLKRYDVDASYDGEVNPETLVDLD